METQVMDVEDFNGIMGWYRSHLQASDFVNGRISAHYLKEGPRFAVCTNCNARLEVVDVEEVYDV